MPRPFVPKILTANALLEGDVIYMASNGAWVRDYKSAHLFTTEDEAQDSLKNAEAQSDKVVGAYLVAAKSGKNGIELLHFREHFRSKGPSNYPHGKQAKMH